MLTSRCRHLHGLVDVANMLGQHSRGFFDSATNEEALVEEEDKEKNNEKEEGLGKQMR